MTEEEILEKLNKSRESASKGNYESAKETISSLKKHELYKSTHTAIKEMHTLHIRIPQ